MSYIVLQIGQCGNQLGHCFFHTVAEILGPSENIPASNFLQEAHDSFFIENDHGKKVARAILIDTESKVVKEITSPQKNTLFSYPSDSSIIQQLGAGNNWTMGYSCYGPSFKEGTLDMIRKQAESCDYISGFLSVMSASGGTGSGVGAYLSEVIRDEYPRTSSANLVVWPFQKGENTVQAYNGILSLSHLQSSSDAIISFENDQLMNLCQQRLGLKDVSLHNLNMVCSQQLANLLFPCKNPSGTACFNDLLAHLVPHPQYKLLSLRSVPQEPLTSLPFSAYNWPGLLRTLRRMVLYNSIVDEIHGRCNTPLNITKTPPVSLANLLVLRGNNLESADPNLLHQPSLPYASWVPPSSRLQTWTHPSSFLNYGRTATLANNGQLTTPCIDSSVSKAWKLFTYKAYFHHYEGHGLTKEEFVESTTQVEQIIANYKVLTPG